MTHISGSWRSNNCFGFEHRAHSIDSLFAKLASKRGTFARQRRELGLVSTGRGRLADRINVPAVEYVNPNETLFRSLNQYVLVEGAKRARIVSPEGLVEEL